MWGALWRCKSCTGCDLCTDCYSDDKHNIGHEFIRIDYPGDSGYVRLALIHILFHEHHRSMFLSKQDHDLLSLFIFLVGVKRQYEESPLLVEKASGISIFKTVIPCRRRL